MNTSDHAALLANEEPGNFTYQSNDDNNNAGDQDVKELKRNLLGFWLIGLCNNFGYVVMLSAAYDILSEQQGEKSVNHTSNAFHCNPTSTGMVLLADILPTLIIKLTAPFYMQNINYHIRVLLVVLLVSSSLLTVAYSQSVAVSLFGVVMASASSGLGEITFLSISTHFMTTTVSAWSSGTGMAGVAGALSYAGLKAVGLSSRNTLLVLLIVPAILVVAFWVLLKMPPSIKLSTKSSEPLLKSHDLLSNRGQDKTKYMSLKAKIQLIIPLLKYMVPLFLVYLAEYTINQGLYELIYYKMSWLKQDDQYRWFQVIYQVGVFISRSSANIIRIKKILVPVVIQYVILVVLLTEVSLTYIPSIWITFLIILLEGLCGGSVYVNAFYLISEEVPADVREFSMGVASVSDSFGIAVAGAISLPIHDALCKMKLR